jgi:hypothetical protein
MDRHSTTADTPTLESASAPTASCDCYPMCDSSEFCFDRPAGERSHVPPGETGADRVPLLVARAEGPLRDLTIGPSQLMSTR